MKFLVALSAACAIATGAPQLVYGGYGDRAQLRHPGARASELRPHSCCLRLWTSWRHRPRHRRRRRARRASRHRAAYHLRRPRSAWLPRWLSATMDSDFPLLPLLPPLRLRSNLDFNLWNLDFNLDSALHKNISVLAGPPLKELHPENQ